MMRPRWILNTPTPGPSTQTGNSCWTGRMKILPTAKCGRVKLITPNKSLTIQTIIMNPIKTICAVLLIAGFAACSKDSVELTPLASLNVVNGTVNLGTIKSNFTGPGAANYYSTITTTTGYAANTAFGVRADMAVPLAIVATTDTTKPVYTNTLNFTNGGVYTLYLAGQSTAVDT